MIGYVHVFVLLIPLLELLNQMFLPPLSHVARDEKELGMIDLEKELVAILLEQQKKVLVLIEDSSFESKNKEIAAVANLPWPPMQNASIANVRKLRREHERREKMIEAGEDPDADEEEG